MIKDNLDTELETEIEITSEQLEKSPTKKDLKNMEVVYADILKPETVDLTGLDDLSDKDKVAVLRISRFIDECRETNRISSHEYAKPKRDEEVRELDISDFESFSSLKGGNYYD